MTMKNFLLITSIFLVAIAGESYAGQGIINKIKGSNPPRIIFQKTTTEFQMPGLETLIIANEHYIEVFVESVRIRKSRRFLTKFHGVIFSFISMARQGQESVTFAEVSKPSNLALLDEKSLNNILVISERIMGPTPYNGGTLELEAGLFSVKSGNLISPVLDYVTQVSDIAGVKHVAAVKPYLPLITGGMDLVAGQVKETSLLVGVDTSINLEKGGVFALIAPKNQNVDYQNLSLDKERRLLTNGKILHEDYIVFSIRSSRENPYFGEIPELKKAFEKIRAAIINNSPKQSFDALASFRLLAISSPDLIPSDAQRLVKLATDIVKEAFPPGGSASDTKNHFGVKTLSEIGLYD